MVEIVLNGNDRFSEREGPLILFNRINIIQIVLGINYSFSTP